MHVFVGVVIGAVLGFAAGVVFSGRIRTAIKSLETTVEAKLTAIETAIKAPIAHTELVAGAALKSEEEYVEEIAAKVLAKLKTAETAIASKL